MTTLADRLVHAASVPLVDHTPGDERTDLGARKAVAAVLREQLAWLDEYKARITERISDPKSRAAQLIGVRLVTLKFIETLAQVESPSPSEGGGTDDGANA